MNQDRTPTAYEISGSHIYKQIIHIQDQQDDQVAVKKEVQVMISGAAVHANLLKKRAKSAETEKLQLVLQACGIVIHRRIPFCCLEYAAASCRETPFSLQYAKCSRQVLQGCDRLFYCQKNFQTSLLPRLEFPDLGDDSIKQSSRG
ncbi:hypothetical protein R1flu_015962 [Riccia fluitans]|uniref:Uncharacterized protein n=1 Tax=Riccia fluitans TaxID=41844 RepID=A0ABD1YKG4_9MARC